MHRKCGIVVYGNICFYNAKWIVVLQDSSSNQPSGVSIWSLILIILLVSYNIVSDLFCTEEDAESIVGHSKGSTHIGWINKFSDFFDVFALFNAIYSAKHDSISFARKTVICGSVGTVSFVRHCFFVYVIRVLRYSW